MVWGWTSRITVAPAATMDHSPILMPGITVAPAPIQAPLAIGMWAQRDMCGRGEGWVIRNDSGQRCRWAGWAGRVLCSLSVLLY